MSVAAITSGSSRTALGLDPLKASAALWFMVAAVGQWLFVYYVIGYYGVRLAANGLAGLTGTPLTGGYVAGDAVGNVAAASHVLLAILIHGGGPLQLIPQIRRRAPAFHRWNGRAFLVAAIVSSVSGLYMHWVRSIGQGWLDVAGNTVTSALIFIFAALALRAAMARNISAHRRWALRLFFAASAVWFMRVGWYGSKFSASVFAIDFKEISSVVFLFMNAAKILLPLAVLELYFWAQDRAGAHGRIAVASLVLVMAVLTAVGSYAVTTIRWLPTIHG
jgi:hypothetical protein